MTKQEIALQLTLKILETQGVIKSNNFSIGSDIPEKYSKANVKLAATIFNDLINELNCE